jgi:hypothetical protein
MGTSTAPTYSASTNAASTYWVRRKGTGACSATTTDGRIVSIAVYPAFSAAGAINSGSATTTAGTNPGATITNSSSASGGNGSITYQWRRIQGSSSVTLTGSASTYSIGSDATNYSTVGTYTFKRYAHDGCNTAWKESSGSYTLTVEDPYVTWTTCSSSNPGFTMISNKQREGSGSMDWNAAKSLCEGIGPGWRLPTETELVCICDNKSSIPSRYVNYYYWSSTSTGSSNYRYLVHFSDCSLNGGHNSDNYFVKCVK